MLRKALNRASLVISIETRTPLLIREGDSGLHPSGVDLSPVRTRHGRFGYTVYCPGSSLKGVIRAAAEAHVRDRSFASQKEVRGACDPLDHKTSCGGEIGQARQKGDSTARIHRHHCLACRTFGSTVMRGRVAVRDLFPWPAREQAGALSQQSKKNFETANHLEFRNGVSINRISGAVQHGPFEQELVPAGVWFWGEIALQNFQAWQLGLLAVAFDELNEGFAQLGSSKSRGLGLVSVKPVGWIYEQTGTVAHPSGVGALVSPEEAQAYGLLAEGSLPALHGATRGLARRFTLDDPEAIQTWLDAGIDALEALG